MASWKTDDGIGGIEVLEVFGNDLTVVNAARVSFAKESTEFVDRDAGLIRYLAKHHHVSPFFHPQRKNQTAAHSKSLQQLGHAGHQDRPWVLAGHDGANVSV